MSDEGVSSDPMDDSLPAATVSDLKRKFEIVVAEHKGEELHNAAIELHRGADERDLERILNEASNATAAELAKAAEAEQLAILSAFGPTKAESNAPLVAMEAASSLRGQRAPHSSGSGTSRSQVRKPKGPLTR